MLVFIQSSLLLDETFLDLLLPQQTERREVRIFEKGKHGALKLSGCAVVQICRRTFSTPKNSQKQVLQFQFHPIAAQTGDGSNIIYIILKSGRWNIYRER